MEPKLGNLNNDEEAGGGGAKPPATVVPAGVNSYTRRDLWEEENAYLGTFRIIYDRLPDNNSRRRFRGYLCQPGFRRFDLPADGVDDLRDRKLVLGKRRR